ncbi:hypothetical protein MRX96_011002 [Rhipicephalus microplus]
MQCLANHMACRRTDAALLIWALEAQVAELDKAGQAKTAQLVRTVAELDEAREKQAQLEKRVEELVTPAAGDDASARAQNNERHAGGNADPQGVTDDARTSGVRQRRADSGNKESPEAAPGSGGSPARDIHNRDGGALRAGAAKDSEFRPEFGEGAFGWKHQSFLQ